MMIFEFLLNVAHFISSGFPKRNTRNKVRMLARRMRTGLGMVEINGFAEFVVCPHFVFGPKNPLLFLTFARYSRDFGWFPGQFSRFPWVP